MKRRMIIIDEMPEGLAKPMRKLLEIAKPQLQVRAATVDLDTRKGGNSQLKKNHLRTQPRDKNWGL